MNVGTWFALYSLCTLSYLRPCVQGRTQLFCSRGAIVIIGRDAHAKILTHSHKFIDHAHNSPDNDELDGFTMRFKLDTTVSVVPSGCRTSKD